jgi:archaemetzincin
MKKIVSLIPIELQDTTILLDLKENLSKIFKDIHLFFEIPKEEMKLNFESYNHMRKQYDASKILNELISNTDKSGVFRVLGIIDEDIYVEGLNFVFGIANMPQFYTKFFAGALISVKRLREEFYGRRSNRELFGLRVLKEAIHELGHTFGLTHCRNNCVMRFSNSLIDTDIKPETFCIDCGNQLIKVK